MKGRILSRSSLLVRTLIGAGNFRDTSEHGSCRGRQRWPAPPVEGPLNQVLASFTGPVAKALCILAIVVIGFGFAFSEGGGLPCASLVCCWVCP